MGVPHIDVYSDPETPTCFGLYNRRNLDKYGRRCSTYDAFLPKPLVRQRENLKICLGSYVQRILFSDTADPLTATGLLVEGDKGELFVVRAKREIIICTGAIVTPQLLLLRFSVTGLYLMSSGVGPKDHLTEVGKPCVHDLPGVGSTLVC